MSMRRFKRALAVWFWGLLGGAAGGGVSALASKFGLDGLHGLGADVPTLTLGQMKYVFLAGVLTHAVMYYMKSPIPPLEFDDSTPPFPLPDGSNTKPNEQTETKP